VHAYFPRLRMVESGALQAAPVAIVVPDGYHPPTATGGTDGGSTPPPTASQCPTPSA
jgi:hypothetical protein